MVPEPVRSQGAAPADAGRDLIVVVDMQNVYAPGQPWGCASFPRACRRIAALLDAAEGAAAPPAVCFTRFLFNPEASGVWAAYNAAHRAVNHDPWLNALTASLRPYAARHPLYHKSVYSSMGIPEVREQAKRCRQVVVAGVVSECCVLATCLEAVDLGLHVVYLRDACSGKDGGTERAVEAILSRLSPLHVTVTDTAAYLQEAFSPRHSGRGTGGCAPPEASR